MHRYHRRRKVQSSPAPSAPNVGRPRKYPLVLCPVGHTTISKNRNTKRYCVRCRKYFTNLTREPELEDEHVWNDPDDKGNDWRLSVAAQRRLLAAIDALNEAEHEQRLAEWRANGAAQQQKRNPAD